MGKLLRKMEMSMEKLVILQSSAKVNSLGPAPFVMQAWRVWKLP